ncbi:MAG: thioredoxin family protein [Saprospiraceae bacterium]|nr:thioredoxin family protein [Saprospiraceae bacterium]
MPMLKYCLSLLLISTLLFLGCKSTQPTSQNTTTETSSPKPKFAFDFAESEQLMPLLDQAKEERKLVFVDFYTDWCLPCRLMERDVFMDKDLGSFFNKNFISYKVDAEKGNGANLAQIFNVKAYPTLLFLNDKGQVLERKEGAAYHSELRAMAESAMSKR